jgi:hypothetical protein
MLCKLDLPHELTNDSDEAADDENNYFSVISSALSGHSLLYVAQIDCSVNPKTSSGLANYGEIKTIAKWSFAYWNFHR